MPKEKRKKIKVVQVRVTPSNFKLYEEYANKKQISKTKLFELFLLMLKEDKI
jgi:hypothetical protein